MKTVANTIAILAAGAMFLGTAAFGQTNLKATIPFAFHAGLSNLPAGDYNVREFDSRGTAVLATLQSRATRSSVIIPGGLKDTWKPGKAAMTFQCSGDAGCYLTSIRSTAGTIYYMLPNKLARGKQMAVISIPLFAVSAD